MQQLLSAGVGVLPLAPVSHVSRTQVSEVVERMAKRFRREVPRSVEAELWTATYVLVGLRYDMLFAQNLLRGVRDIMKESVTYQAIVEEGWEKGRIAQKREDVLKIAKCASASLPAEFALPSWRSAMPTSWRCCWRGH